MVAYGRAEMPTAMAFVIISSLASAVANAQRQLEARLKTLEERLAKCEQIPASAP
jgi:transcription elongation GreA/GreB family factor